MQMLKKVALSSVAILLCGCGPMYETQYNYAPPKSAVGVMCVSTCEANRGNCRQMQDMQKQNCEYRADQEYHWCVKHSDDKHKDQCYRTSCNADYAVCDDQYRGCYQACGGTVTANQVCVAFCNNK